MEEWSVRGSGSEEDNDAATTYIDVKGIKIPPHRLLELMQAVHTRKTVELDSLSAVYSNKRRKKKKKKKKSSLRLSGGSKAVEDASETASEVRSTTGTSTTATECRDMRRRKYDPLFDDPEFDDNDTLSPSKSSVPTKIKKAPPPHKEQQLARLDKITADKQKRKQRWHLLNSLSESHPTPLPAHKQLHKGPEEVRVDRQHPPASLLQNNQRGPPQLFGKDAEVEEVEKMEVDGEDGGIPTVMFDDDSTDKGESESDSDMKCSLLPQINKVEQLLDFEVS